MSKHALAAKAALAAGTSAWNYMAKRGRAVTKSSRRPRARGARRRAARLRFKRKTRPGQRKTQQAGEWDYSKRNVTVGKRPRHNLRYVDRMLSAHTERVQFYATQMSAFGGTNGANYLANKQAADGAILQAPIKLFDVTSCMNVINNAVVAGQCAQDLWFTNETATATVQWQGYNSQKWALNNAPEASVGYDNFPNEKSYLEWVNARFMFYAPTGLPTKIQIDLVQFKDDRLVPSAPLTGEALGYGGVAAATSDAFTAAFWQYMLKKFMYNQIEPMDNTFKKYYKVIKSMTMYLDPKETTDASNTRYREVNFFANLNKRLNYRWQETDRVNMDASDTQINTDVSNLTEVHPRYRTYIMVRAVAKQATTNSSANHPSFDWFIRTRHTVLN